MTRTMLRGKIHRAMVTGADLHYEGSIGIDPDLYEAAGILPYEKVDIYNVSNGERFSTYVIKGERGSGEICINGAAAHKGSKGDIVIIACYVQADDSEAQGWKPKAVYVDGANRITSKTGA